ncbi:MAG: hypothetical protein KME64_10220 [Scytonematopsis contorta HA4267-MV1]|jgi:predicted transposase YdaD|nr:hypothetical protein [Scytonematopsis contorta HA4267-MV1]
MQESVIYQKIEAQAKEKGFALGREEGRVLGREEGREEKARLIALNLLNEEMSVDLIARVTRLTVEQVQQLQRSKKLLE